MARGGAARMEWNFRKEMPRHFEVPRENSRRYAAVPQISSGTRFAREPMQNANTLRFRVSPRIMGETRIRLGI
jgi:hypothetical protein